MARSSHYLETRRASRPVRTRKRNTMTQAHVTITTGQSFGNFRNGAKGTVSELRRAALRAGLVVGARWDDGSVPVYRDEDERDADTDGDACDMLIRACVE